ncbi:MULTISPECIES: hypothetical protein [Emticicia]|uniref:hypothetical protein n=1 Tax=Emticicia TaxID=312278 RepID=UPI0020A21F1C|nr:MULTISPECIES: hypothetical protein [Emticicia]UTA68939.1 hypothetical protein MB380_03835 [Emticicia sp. 21SJ11W-3]
MENQLEIQTEKPEKEVQAKKTWVKPAMRALNTAINASGTGTSEGGTGVPS